MSRSSQANDSGRPTIGTRLVVDDDGKAGDYLTDGVNLYRLLGAIARGRREMVGIENCRSLDVVLVPADELRGWRLRPIASACRRAAVDGRGGHSRRAQHVHRRGSLPTGARYQDELTSLSSASLLATALPLTWREGVTFVAPDEGAVGRCAAIAEAAGACGPIVHVRKRRTAAGLEHLGLVGEPGRRALVADDILDTGDTLVSCVRHLRGAGVDEIVIVATHGLRWHALLREGVQRLWITDTVLSRRRPPEAEVVPVASLLVPALAGAID